MGRFCDVPSWWPQAFLFEYSMNGIRDFPVLSRLTFSPFFMPTLQSWAMAVKRSSGSLIRRFFSRILIVVVMISLTTRSVASPKYSLKREKVQPC